MRTSTVPPEGAAPQPLVIVGPYQPAAIAQLLPPEAAAQLAGLTNFAGIPVNWLAGALTHAGIPATLIGGVRDATPRFIQGDSLSVAVYRASGGWPFVLNGRRAERHAILALLRQLQPAVVHAHWTLEAGRAVGDWGGPKILTVHDAAWEYARLGWSAHPIGVAYGLRWLANTTATLSRFRHLIAVSPFLESYLRLRHRFQGEIRVIPNAVPELPADLAIPQRFPKSGRVTFACFGDRGRLKNIERALQAFRIIAPTLPEARMIVFGTGWEGYAAETGLGDRLEFRGSLPHREFLEALAGEIDIWVHPSRMETHGIVFCEAIQAGCPVIAGQGSGAVPWALDYGRSGLLVDIESAAALADAMRRLVLDRAAAGAMVAHGRQFIREHFNPERILALHLQYYRDVA